MSRARAAGEKHIRKVERWREVPPFVSRILSCGVDPLGSSFERLRRPVTPRTVDRSGRGEAAMEIIGY